MNLEDVAQTGSLPYRGLAIRKGCRFERLPTASRRNSRVPTCATYGRFMESSCSFRTCTRTMNPVGTRCARPGRPPVLRSRATAEGGQVGPTAKNNQAGHNMAGLFHLVPGGTANLAVLGGNLPPRSPDSKVTELISSAIMPCGSCAESAGCSPQTAAAATHPRSSS
jgi:hypothetical protein